MAKTFLSLVDKKQKEVEGQKVDWIILYFFHSFFLFLQTPSPI
jgi:hypothetical protein